MSYKHIRQDKRNKLKRTQTKATLNHRKGRRYCIEAGCSKDHK